MLCKVKRRPEDLPKPATSAIVVEGEPFRKEELCSAQQYVVGGHMRCQGLIATEGLVVTESGRKILIRTPPKMKDQIIISAIDKDVHVQQIYMIFYETDLT